MPQKNRDPVALAGADRAPKLFDVFPTPNDSDHIACGTEIQAGRPAMPRESQDNFRAGWLARRYGLRPALAGVVAGLAFDGGRP